MVGGTVVGGTVVGGTVGGGTVVGGTVVGGTVVGGTVVGGTVVGGTVVAGTVVVVVWPQSSSHGTSVLLDEPCELPLLKGAAAKAVTTTVLPGSGCGNEPENS